MAEKVIRVCDAPASVDNDNGTKCGEEATKKIIVGFDGHPPPTKYDICDRHEKMLLTGILAIWHDARAPRSSSKKKRSDDGDKIRAWAETQGIALSPRGRIPAEVRNAWETAGRP